MKTIIASLFALSLTACMSMQPSGPYNPITAQCEYEANIATVNIRDPIMGGVQSALLYNQCVQIRSALK